MALRVCLTSHACMSRLWSCAEALQHHGGCLQADGTSTAGPSNAGMDEEYEQGAGGSAPAPAASRSQGAPSKVHFRKFPGRLVHAMPVVNCKMAPQLRQLAHAASLAGPAAAASCQAFLELVPAVPGYVAAHGAAARHLC